MKEFFNKYPWLGALALILYLVLVPAAIGAVVGGLFFGLPIYFLGIKTGLIVGSSIIAFIAFCFLFIRFFREY